MKGYLDSGSGKVISMSTKPEPDTTELHGKYKKLDCLIKGELVKETDGKFVFVDSYNAFMDLGNPRDLYALDGLHLSPKGYWYWNSWLEAALADTTGCTIWRGGECVDDEACALGCECEEFGKDEDEVGTDVEETLGGTASGGVGVGVGAAVVVGLAFGLSILGV